ncbi:MAG: AAA family ATPase [Spirochaetia bacterium]
MTLTRVRMHPFGFFTDRAVDFAPGLNVVLGPNEAGKSTLFHAVRHALFVPAKLRKPEYDAKIAPHLPASGGDSIRVELEICRGGERWTLKRRWGAAAASELVLPGGGSLGDEAAIKTRLSELLPARPGAVAHILMTPQSSLAETLELLRKDGRESLSDLADILRRAVLETGGVSVDRFVARLTGDRAKAFARWDPAARAPEMSRGTEKRWRDGGTVHAAWWAKEDIGAAYKRALAYEAGMDELNAQLRVAAAACGEKESFLKAHAGAAKDAGERRALEAEHREASREAAALQKIVEDWPVAEYQARTMQEAMSEADSARASLETELQVSQKAEEDRGLREKRARVLRRKAAADEAASRLAAMPKLERKSLDDIRAAAAALSRLEAGIEAGRISVTVAGRADVELAAQEDFGPEERKKLGPGQAIHLRAAGRVRLVHRDMEIEVRTGDADAQARAEEAETARASLRALLSRHGVTDLPSAEDRYRAWQDCASDLRAAEKSLSDELAGETFADFEARAAALGPAAPARPLQQVIADLASSRAQAAARTRDLSDVRRRLDEWRAAHGTVEKLVTSLSVVKGREADLLARIARAAAVPEGFADAEAFLAAFEKAREDFADAKARLAGLKARKQEMEKEGEAPGYQSAEELAVQLQDAHESFDAELRRAEAMDRLVARSAALMRTSDNVVFSGMKAQLSAMIATMTTGRHADIEMDGAVPVALFGDNGKAIAWEQLSAGTKDTLALALRLAMASYFLGDADGFMLLDDPLVDMDPDRQKAAAAALQAFAASRQLILFTCHPAVAEVLGGNLVTLGAEG